MADTAKTPLSVLLKAALSYFALVFTAGFVLGVIRVTTVVPSLGVRNAELLEMPVMLVVILFAAQFVVRRFQLFSSRKGSLGVGLLALCLLVIAELVLVGGLQSRSVVEYLASRDPVAGSVYLFMLLLYGTMPAFLARTTTAR